MRAFSQSKNALHPTDNPDMGTTHHKRLYSRNKSSSHVVSSSKIKSIDKQNKNTRIIRIRLVFIRIGEIDTLNEKYQADVYFEARWTETMDVTLLDLKSPQQQSQLLNDYVTIRVDHELPRCWSPELFIENAIGQIGEQEKWVTIKRNVTDNNDPLTPPVVSLDICEHRRIKGVFWEKLELNHFPADVQDLTISITTHHHKENCLLVQDEHLRSSINREAFYDQQEWKLYEHVAYEEKDTEEEYSFQDGYSGLTQKKHPVLAITCRAARRPGYYYWNGFCLIFLITVCSFCIFSIPPDLPQSRLQITCTLLLTSVTFRWVVNRSLPTISYLTTLDKYAIMSIIILVLLCVWHSIIAFIVFINPEPLVLTKAIGPGNTYVHVDRFVFITVFSFYILFHILLIIWLIFVPYKRRRQMTYLDSEYAAKKHIQLESRPTRLTSTQSQSRDLVFRRTSSIQGNLPIIKSPIRPMKRGDGVIVIPNASTFITIKEESNGMGTKGINAVELQEQDDVFYDHTNDINNELKNTQIQPIQKS